jgi:hypothetical protein
MPGRQASPGTRQDMYEGFVGGGVIFIASSNDHAA